MRKRASWMVLLCAVALGPGLAAAENDPNLDPGQQPATGPGDFSETRLLPPPEEAVWGTTRGARWIAASQFTVTLNNGPALDYAGNHFYRSPGSASPERYFAQLDVEPGSAVDGFTCVYDDSSPVNEMTFQMHRYRTNLSTGATANDMTFSYMTSGTPGVESHYVGPLVPPITVVTRDDDELFNWYLAVDVANDTRIAGCWVWYRRQVAPAPPTASFADVSATSPYFRYVEAIAAAGITGGCGGGNFCPDAPITRGQMAVFLAVALGIGYRY